MKVVELSPRGGLTGPGAVGDSGPVGVGWPVCLPRSPFRLDGDTIARAWFSSGYPPGLQNLLESGGTATTGGPR